MPRELKEEKVTQKKLLKYLKDKNVFHWRQNNGRIRGKYQVSIKGISDIIILCKGLFVAIECKSTYAKRSDDQVTFQNNVVKNGGVALVAYDYDETIAELQKLGI